MQSLMGETPKTALHRYSLLPIPCSLFPVPFALRVSRSDRLPTDSKCLGIPPIRSKTDFWD
ncbi:MULTISPECIES: hypothetical protein [unclassified Moorena]|uniref:hypothetical protein n=1 Tax=unclassified Moorena TaxID=2683338 RepID=UPI0013FE9026|nr:MULTISPECIES: hypothetical protein [unclassified Moorena]NEO11443.1 hypothetical protein [Moorena sp. SIO3E8]NEP97903.1 hypothetical protein [Moorena sp. SIO3F7]